MAGREQLSYGVHGFQEAERKGPSVFLPTAQGEIGYNPSYRLVYLPASPRQPVSLTLPENTILRLAAAYPLRVIPIRQMLEESQKMGFHTSFNTMSAHLSKLRAKIHDTDPDHPILKSIHSEGITLTPRLTTDELNIIIKANKQEKRSEFFPEVLLYTRDAHQLVLIPERHEVVVRSDGEDKTVALDPLETKILSALFRNQEDIVERNKLGVGKTVNVRISALRGKLPMLEIFAARSFGFALKPLQSIEPTGVPLLYTSPYGDLRYYPRTKTVYSPLRLEKDILTPIESVVLETLLRHPLRVFSRADLLRAAARANTDDLRSHMVRLRKKLGEAEDKQLIATVRERGYTLTPYITDEDIARAVAAKKENRVTDELPQVYIESTRRGDFILIPERNLAVSPFFDAPKRITLDPEEAEILNILMEFPEKVVSFKVNTQIYRLRRKLGDATGEFIRVMLGKGVAIRPELSTK